MSVCERCTLQLQLHITIVSIHDNSYHASVGQNHTSNNIFQEQGVILLRDAHLIVVYRKFKIQGLLNIVPKSSFQFCLHNWH